MTDQEAPPRFPDASAITPDGAPALPPVSEPAADGSSGRPELLIAGTFIGGFVAAKILKRLGSQ